MQTSGRTTEKVGNWVTGPNRSRSWTSRAHPNFEVRPSQNTSSKRQRNVQEALTMAAECFWRKPSERALNAFLGPHMTSVPECLNFRKVLSEALTTY